MQAAMYFPFNTEKYECVLLSRFNFGLPYLFILAENKKELSVYSKNYLPILLNLYTAEEKEGDPDKLPVLETVRVYLAITEPKVSIPFDSVSVP